MSKMERLYVDFHVIQTVPPSCVNRDDTGSPKMAVYGGVTRARVSSQCWKHAMRKSFRDILEKADIGTRTKCVKKLIAEEILSLAPAADAEKLAEEIMADAGFKVDKKKDTLKALFFISDAQIKALAELAVKGNGEDKNKGKGKNKEKEDLVDLALKASPSADMALFGRMVARDKKDAPSLNYDAAAQVAHAISTHAVHNEYDYFTAVDDCQEDLAEAAHLGTVEYNSATLYRYATVNVKELQNSVGTKTVEIVSAFADAFISSMPTGKQNTFANRTLPDFVYITVRKDQPINLVGAFEQPVGGKNGYSQASVQALAEHAKEVYQDFACEPYAVFCCGKGAELFGEKKSVPEILEELGNTVDTLLED